jgi:hypothetical protein
MNTHSHTSVQIRCTRFFAPFHRRSISRRSRQLVGIIAVCCVPFPASNATAATLSGVVSDSQTRRYVKGATVTLRNTDRVAVTDDDGRFVFRDVPTDSYTIDVESLGYKAGTQVISLGADETRSTEFQLSADVLTLGDFVVEGEREGLARSMQQKRTARQCDRSCLVG